MQLIRWEPFRDVVSLSERMNRFFENSVVSREGNGDSVASSWSPSVDIYENEDEIALNAEIPGIDEKDIEIKIEDNILSLKGERKWEDEKKEENYHRIERSYGSFFRSFRIPNNIDQEKIRAEHEDGVLKIHLPKKHESKPRKVKVLKPEKKVKSVKAAKK